MNQITLFISMQIRTADNSIGQWHNYQVLSQNQIETPEDLDKTLQSLAIGSDQMVSELGKTLGISRKKP